MSAVVTPRFHPEDRLPGLALSVLISLIVVPALVLVFAVSPWFFVVLFLLPLLVAIPLATRRRERSPVFPRDEGPPQVVVVILLGPAFVLCAAALIVGIL